MKKILSLLLATTALIGINSCDKADELAHHESGVAPVLSANTTTVAPAPADSLNKVVTFSWTSPNYATNPATVKYILQFDSATKNFAHPQERIVHGDLSDSILAKDFNTILLNLGFKFNVPGKLEVRLISSYANNNDQKISNTVTLNATAYLIPPKVNPPASGRLFLVGNATQGGWSNPVPVPTQEFGKINDLTYVGVFNLIGGGQYLALPVNGSWDEKFSIANNTIPGIELTGDFGFGLSDNFKGPATSGWYKITLDFQMGKYYLEPYVGAQLPTNLYIVGSATPNGWNNDNPAPAAQTFTRLNSVQWQIASLPMPGGNEYLILPVAGDWGHKYAVANNSIAGLANGGFFGYDLGQNFPAPTLAGNYKIEVNFGIQDPASPTNSAWFKTTKL